MSIVSKLLAKAAKKEAEAAAARSLRVARPAARAEARAPLAVARPAPKALPAPPKRLALPAPGPKLPPEASKPRGGQFWADKPLGGTPEEMGFRVHDRGEHASPNNRFQIQAPEGHVVGMGSTPEWVEQRMGALAAERATNYSPEAAARKAATDHMPFGTPDDDPLKAWLQKALAKYYKTDFGSPTDPLRDLAARGLHYDPDMSPDKWTNTVDDFLMEDRIGDYTLPTPREGYRPDPATGGKAWYNAELERRGVLESMPWLAKAPVTDKLYGIRGSGLDIDHFADEMRNALAAQEAGLPMDLAVRPESLQRMSFPQAVEHVGRINQYRAAQMQEANLAAQQNPAIKTYKEYPENNPRGLRWVQLRQPEYTPDTLPEGYELRPMTNNLGNTYYSLRADGEELGVGQTPEAAIKSGRRWMEDDNLAQALRYEGDTMGHCVGGYCDDVTEGRSNIYSLRDAKGEPHVTIETAPRGRGWLSGDQLDEWEPGLFAQYQNDLNARATYGGDIHKWLQETRPDLANMQDIVQIKGKQNRAPNDDYLPFVQDFVKSGQWGNVGDLRNSQLTRLPDGRYITEQQWREGMGAGLREANPAWEDEHLQRQLAQNYPRVEQNPHTVAERWPDLMKHFEGFAAGGRVDADRCFCNNPLSVRRG